MLENRQMRLEEWSQELLLELRGNIVPFWRRMRSEEGLTNGLANDGSRIPDCPLSLVYVARVLWFFSRFYRFSADEQARQMADFAAASLYEEFHDERNGGYFWNTDGRGQILDRSKKTYGQAFAIYAFSEHYRACSSSRSQARAKEAFEIMEAKCRDEEHGGYIEVFSEDWSRAADLRLGEADLDAPKSMNNHLHIIESYMNLLAADRSARVEASATQVLHTILDRIVDPRHPRFRLFFDENWNVLSETVSPGHDIEGAWLLCEAAEAIGEEGLIARVRRLSVDMSREVLANGCDSAGAILSEYESGRREEAGGEREWWPQAEAMVGFLNAYQLSGEEVFLQASEASWGFVKRHLIDREGGEWFWGVDRSRHPLDKEKAGPWKGPYHNGRACIETIERLRKLESRTCS